RKLDVRTTRQTSPGGQFRFPLQPPPLLEAQTVSSPDRDWPRQSHNPLVPHLLPAVQDGVLLVVVVVVLVVVVVGGPLLRSSTHGSAVAWGGAHGWGGR